MGLCWQDWTRQVLSIEWIDLKNATIASSTRRSSSLPHILGVFDFATGMTLGTPELETAKNAAVGPGWALIHFQVGG